MDETDACSEGDLMVCGACKRTFQLTNIAGFIKHKKFDCEDPGIASDPKSKTLVCLTCRQKFKTPWSLLKHAQNVHFLQIYLEQAYNLGIQSVQIAEDHRANSAYSPLPGMDQSLNAALPVGQTVQQWIQGMEKEIEQVEGTQSDTSKSQAQDTCQHIRGRNESCAGAGCSSSRPTTGKFVSAGNMPQRGRKNIENILPSLTSFSARKATGQPSIGKMMSSGTQPGRLSVSAVPDRCTGQCGQAVANCTPSLISNGKMTPVVSHTGKIIPSIPLTPSQGKMIPDMASLAGNETNLPSASVPKVIADTNSSYSFGKLMPDFSHGPTASSGYTEAACTVQSNSKAVSSSKAVTSFGKFMPDLDDITDGRQYWNDVDVDMVAQDTSQIIQNLGNADDDNVTSSNEDTPQSPDIPPAPVSPCVATAVTAVHESGTQTCPAFTKAPLRPKSTEVIVKKAPTDQISSGHSSKDQERCCDKEDCCKAGQESWCCSNQDCGITIMPVTHKSLERCCSAVIPKKRKRHMEIKHKYAALFRARRRDKGKPLSLASSHTDPVSPKPVGSPKASGNIAPADSGQDVGSYSHRKSEAVPATKPFAVPSKHITFSEPDLLTDNSVFLENSGDLLSGSLNVQDTNTTQLPATSMYVPKSFVGIVTPPAPVMAAGSSSLGKLVDIEDIGINVSQAVIKTQGLSTRQFDRTNTAVTNHHTSVIETVKQSMSFSSPPLLTSIPLQSVELPTPPSLSQSMVVSSDLVHLSEFDLQVAEVETSRAQTDASLLSTGGGTASHSSGKEQTPSGKKRRYPTSRPYKCDECDHSFNQRIHLRKHQSKHTGIKPYKCDQCDYATVERSHLRVHMRIHTGEKPFKCPYCDYATAQNSTLKIHLNRHHSMSRRPAGNVYSKPGDSNSGRVVAALLQAAESDGTGTGMPSTLSPEQLLSEVA